MRRLRRLGSDDEGAGRRRQTVVGPARHPFGEGRRHEAAMAISTGVAKGQRGRQPGRTRAVAANRYEATGAAGPGRRARPMLPIHEGASVRSKQQRGADTNWLQRCGGPACSERRPETHAWVGGPCVNSSGGGGGGGPQPGAAQQQPPQARWPKRFGPGSDCKAEAAMGPPARRRGRRTARAAIPVVSDERDLVGPANERRRRKNRILISIESRIKPSGQGAGGVTGWTIPERSESAWAAHPTVVFYNGHLTQKTAQTSITQTA